MLLSQEVLNDFSSLLRNIAVMKDCARLQGPRPYPSQAVLTNEIVDNRDQRPPLGKCTWLREAETETQLSQQFLRETHRSLVSPLISGEQGDGSQSQGLSGSCNRPTLDCPKVVGVPPAGGGIDPSEVGASEEAINCVLSLDALVGMHVKRD
jgi:hypothetical protein